MLYVCCNLLFFFFFFGEYNQRYKIYQQSPDSFQHGPESRIIGAGAVWKCSIDQFRLEQKKRGLVNNVDQIKHRWNMRGGGRGKSEKKIVMWYSSNHYNDSFEIDCRLIGTNWWFRPNRSRLTTGTSSSRRRFAKSTARATILTPSATFWAWRSLRSPKRRKLLLGSSIPSSASTGVTKYNRL